MMFGIPFKCLARVFDNHHCACKVCNVYLEFNMLYNEFRIMSNTAPHTYEGYDIWHNF